VPRPHLLYVAWGFPPSRGSGVYRALATANAFAEAGWNVTVLTAPREVFIELFGADTSLEERVHPAIRVRQVKQELPHIDPDLAHWSRSRVASEPAWFSAFNRASERDFPERVYGGWARNLRAAAEQVHEAHPVDLVVGTANPNVDFVPGEHLKQAHGVPYVMDYRDGWALDVTTGHRSSAEGSRAWRREAALLEGAEEAWFVNEPIRAWYAETAPSTADRTKVVANGYDGDLGADIDAARADRDARPVGPNDPLTFGYLGTLYGRVPIRELLEGWRAARARDPRIARSELVLRGHVGHQGRPDERAMALLAEFADDGIRHAGPVPKARVAEVYAGFDVLTLPLIPGRYVTSGKVFEYAASGLPIVSVHGADSAATSVLSGHPAWVLTGSMGADDVADAVIAGAYLATEGADETVAQTRRWAQQYARGAQLAPRIEHLGELVARRAREAGRIVPTPSPHDDGPRPTRPGDARLATARPGAGSTADAAVVPRRVVVVVGSEAPADEALASIAGGGNLADRLGTPDRPAQVTVVCRVAPAAGIEGVSDVVVVGQDSSALGRLSRTGAYGAAESAAARSVPGRVLASISPMDPTRTMWRAVRASGPAVDAVRGADLVVAADLPAVRTAWSMLRRGAAPRAVYGVSAAERMTLDRIDA
jgi:glycosyltransferase involved in cell wall biosynthesis